MTSTSPPPRVKILRAVNRLQHRYDLYRAVAQAATLVTLLGVPLSGLVRVDLWRGEHRLFFRPAPLKVALAGVVIGIAASYVVTFLSNVVAGRMFCGWGCPVAQVSRFAEAAWLGSTAAERRRGHLQGAAYSAAAAVAVLAWWVDPRVLVAGSAEPRALAWAAVVAVIGLAFAHGRYWRWGFCQSACPIGLYYSFVSPALWFGVHFRDQAASCIECDACDRVCPVDLAPRDLWAPVPARGGLAIPDAPGRNHCLECGDCVRACEMVLARHDTPIPLRLGWYQGPQREPHEPGCRADAAPAA